MWYDMILNRLYIPGGDELVIVDTSQQVPQDQTFPGGTIAGIATVPPSSRRLPILLPRPQRARFR